MSTAARTWRTDRATPGTTDERFTSRRVRRLRDHRRPRQGDDLPLALPARAPRPAGLPDRGRGRRRLDSRPTCASTPASASWIAERRSTKRRSIASRRGCRTCPATSATTADLRAASPRDRRREQPGLLSRDPAVAVRDGDQGPGRRGPDRLGARGGGEAVRARRRLGGRARRGGPPVPARSPSSTGSTTSWARWAWSRSSTCGSRTRCSSRSGTATTSVGPDHDGRELRGRGPRPLLRPRRRAARRRGQPPDAGGRGHRDGATGQPATRRP